MFTVERFLNSGLLPWFEILSGESSLDEKPIEYVTVIELPVEDFVRKNELVISTAVGCDKDDALMLELITGIHRAQACALLLTNPTDTVRLPQCCMDYILEKQFPVIFIPWECRFADLIESVLNRIREDTASELAFYEEVQKKLLSSYLNNMDINCAAQIITDHFHSECAIYDVNNHIKGACAGILKNGGAAGELNDPDSAIQIKTGERLYGYLHLPCGENVNVTLIGRYLMAPLILWFDKEIVIQSAKQGEKDDFVWRLAKGSSDSREELIQKGQLLGFNLLLPYICVIGKIHLDHLTSYDDANKWIAYNINSIKEEILALSGSLQKRVMLTYQQDLLILFIEVQSAYNDFYTNSFLDKLEEKFATVFPRLMFSWGLSDVSEDPREYCKIYLHAKLAQDLCPKKISRSVRFSYESTVIFNMLSALASDPQIKDDAFSVILPVIEYDRANNSNLLYTLKIYLQLKNVSETARILHLHRQSLLYRLNKIEELTGMAVKNPDNSFLLEVCVRLYMRD